MADKSQSIRHSINFVPKDAAEFSETNDLGVNSADDRLVYNNGSGAQNLLLQSDADSASFTAADNVDYSNTGSGLTSTNVQDAIDEINDNTDTVTTGLSDHLSDTVDAHDASAISVVAAGGISSTTVQAAIEELDTEKAPKASPTFSGTVTSPNLNGVAATTLTIQSATDANVSIQAQGTGKVSVESVVFDGTAITGVTSLANASGDIVVEGITLSSSDNRITGASGSALGIYSASGENVSIQAQGSGSVLLNGITIQNTSEIVGATKLDSSANEITVQDLTINKFSNSLTATAAADFTVQGASGVALALNAQGSGTVDLKKGGTTVAFVDTLAFTVVNQGEMRLREASGNGTNYVAFKGASNMASNYTVTMPAAAPGSNTTLVYDGSNFTWSTAGGWSSSVQTSLSAAGTITISLTQGQQAIEVQGNGAAVTLSSVPFGSSDPSDKTVLRLIGRSNTNTVTLTNNDAANGALLNGTATLGLGDVLELMYISSIDRWVECYRNF